jgi:hypothetical protein
MRYMRIDDDFLYATEFGLYDPVGPTVTPGVYDGFNYDGANELYYDVNVDNQLAGFQLGANLNYCYCKYAFFCDSNFGVYNNHINSYQRLFAGDGSYATYADGSGNFANRATKDDIAFLGEMRLGGAYNFTCNMRGTLAYRVVALNGVALSTDQIPSDFSTPAYVGLIDADGSLVIHGVQAGVECKY